MSLQERIKELLTEHGLPFHTNDKSIITTCPSCSKPKHFYVFKESGFGTCMRCGWQGGSVEMCVMVSGCSYRDAQAMLETSQPIKAGDRLVPRLGTPVYAKQLTELEEIPLPYNFFVLEPRFIKAWNYVINRGVTPEIIQKYDLRYCPDMDRVIIPVKMNGKYYGYQGRDITGKSQISYLSPPKMSRSKVLMGYENIDRDVNHIILTEGPFDFLKVSFLENVVCSMGKNVSGDQIDLLNSLPSKNIYLALDPDAFWELDKIVKKIHINKNVYLMLPPEWRKDFGEATIQEVLKSFNEAKKYSKIGQLPTNFLK